jgi:hypothetical protein
MTFAALVLVACVLITAAAAGCLILRDDTGEHAAPRPLPALRLRARPATGDARPLKLRVASPRPDARAADAVPEGAAIPPAAQGPVPATPSGTGPLPGAAPLPPLAHYDLDKLRRALGEEARVP